MSRGSEFPTDGRSDEDDAGGGHDAAGQAKGERGSQRPTTDYHRRLGTFHLGCDIRNRLFEVIPSRPVGGDSLR